MRKYIFLSLLSLFLVFCNPKAYSNLDPASKLFLSQVQYIISKKEKKEFLELKTQEQRKKFIEDFWRARDPDPSTKLNEFEEFYMARVRFADKLFREGEKPGWETDRGMVYILLGPPSDRYTQPVTNSSDVKAYEIWYYEDKRFRVTFADRIGTGHYVLYESASAAFYSALQQARTAFSKAGSIALFEFTVLPVFKGEGLFLKMKVPLRNLLYKKKDGKFFSKVEISVSGRAGDKKLNLRKEFQIPVKKKVKESSTYLFIQIPFVSGEYFLEVKLKDKISGAISTKKVKFNIKRRK